MKFNLFVTILLVVLSCSLVFSQALTLHPYGVSPAAVKADTVGDPDYLGIKDRVATGLSNVGVETKVYLIGTFEDSSLTALVWDLYEKPASSAAELSGPTTVDEASEIATFVPDLAGTYRISVTEGSFADTVVINASTFRGVKGQAPNCSNCHQGTFADWEETGHADFLENALNGMGRSGSSCLSCHTTGWDELAENDGFDDFEFVYPDTQFAGQADSMRAKYPDAMVRANIQCESCHGPGGAHVMGGNKTDSKMVSSIGPDACASCHDDDHYHVYPSQWDVSNHAELEHPYTRSSCAQCHNGKGFIQYVDGGKVELAEDVDANYNITCAVCHDPHDATNVNQLRTLEITLPNGDEIIQGGKGKLCMNCHNSRRVAPERIESDLARDRAPEPHHGPQAEMLAALNIETFGLSLPTSPHLQAAEDGCVNCHMYEAGSHGEHDPEGNLNTSGMHSFAMVSQQGVDNVGSCSPCHAAFGEDFGDKKFYLNGNADHDGNGIAEGLQHEVHGLLDTLHAALPTDEEGEFIVDSTTTYEVGAAIYNYYFVEEDRSLGIHNPAFAVSLLQASIDVVRGVSSVDTRGFTPVEYELSQNYPNPFNPTTKIDFSIRKAGKVQIRVYDMLGREVATLLDKDMTSGKHTVDFDANNLASGVYIYRIVAGGEFSAVKKMVLIR